MSKSMENPFKNYALSPDDVIIHPEFVAELKKFNEALEIITLAVAENLAHEGFLERVVTGKSSLFLRQEIKELNEIEWTSFDDAMEQIAHAMIAGFDKAVDDSEEIDFDVSVEVNLVISDYTLDQAGITLSAVSESEKLK
jgi:hypothetical protein